MIAREKKKSPVQGVAGIVERRTHAELADSSNQFL
jgi:hypothetical protein